MSPIGRLVLVALLLAPAAVAAPDVVMPPSGGAGRPVDLEGLARDLRGEHTGNRGYAARELKRRIKHTSKVLRRRNRVTIEHQEARVQRSDEIRVVAPAAAACVREWPGQRAACAVILQHLPDPKWRPSLETGLRDAKGSALKQVTRALQVLDGTLERP